MHGLNGGGLLQDTVSPMGDMVHWFVLCHSSALLMVSGQCTRRTFLGQELMKVCIFLVVVSVVPYVLHP
jgi:hypothetical protein